MARRMALVALADDKCRVEHMVAIKRKFTTEEALGREVPVGWDRARPWTTVFMEAAMDERFWDNQVRHQAIK